MANLATGSIADARKAFTDAGAASADTSDSKRFQKLAKIGLIRCDTAEEKAAESITALRAMIAEQDSTDALAFA